MGVVHRKRLQRQGDLGTARYLTCSCQHRLPLLGNPLWRDEFTRCLAAARARCGFSLLAWVVMPEHFHLMLAPQDPRWPVKKILVAIKQPVGQRAIARWVEVQAPILPRIRLSDGRYRYWLKGGGFDRSVRNEDELTTEIKYIHMNPVKRGLVQRPSEWEWSSARWYLSAEEARQGMVPIDPPREQVAASVRDHLLAMEQQ